MIGWFVVTPLISEGWKATIKSEEQSQREEAMREAWLREEALKLWQRKQAENEGKPQRSD